MGEIYKEPKPEQKQEVEKPEFLYHASQEKDIEEFEPRAETVRNKEEGPVVFGTSNIEYASMFIVESDDSWTSRGYYNGVPTMIISDEERFRKLDKGGAIYTLPSENFQGDPDPERKGRVDEWVSREKIKPKDKVVYESGLDAMLANGIKVYFVDEKTFEAIQKSDDQGYEILKSLEPYKSEK